MELLLVNDSCPCDSTNTLQAGRDFLPSSRTVDIIYMFLRNPKVEYYSKQYFWILPSVAQSFSTVDNETQTSDTRIHIVTDSADILLRAKSLGYYGHDVNILNSKVTHAYRKLVHDSVSSLEYEVTILRWKYYRMIMNDWNKEYPNSPMTRIVTLDGDVLMTMNVPAFFDSVIRSLTDTSTLSSTERQITANQTRFEFINVALGVVGLFSPVGLSAFDEFIDEWYNGTIEEVLKRNYEVASYGKQNFFSDMILQEKFIASNTIMRNRCFEYFLSTKEQGMSYYEKWRLQPNHQCLLMTLGCIPMSNYRSLLKLSPFIRFLIDGTNTPRQVLQSASEKRITEYSLSIQAENEKYPYCFMVGNIYLLTRSDANGLFVKHFQGKELKKLLYGYGQLFETILQKNHTRGHALDGSDPNYVLFGSGKSIFYFNKTTRSLHPIGSMDSFHQRQLKLGDVIHPFPMSVLDSLPQGPALSVE
jgi:hypothetical protein